MSRSLRKGPYIQEALEKRVIAMNEGTMKKEVIKTWSRSSMISPDFVGHTIVCTTVTSLFRCTSLRTWLVTNSVSLLRRVHSGVTVVIVNK